MELGPASDDELEQRGVVCVDVVRVRLLECVPDFLVICRYGTSKGHRTQGALAIDGTGLSLLEQEHACLSAAEFF